MKRHLLYAAAAFAVLGVAASCDDEVMTPDPDGAGNDSIIGGDSTQVDDIDVLPLDTLIGLFQGTYPTWNYGPLCEFSSDNIVDNNSVNVKAWTRELVAYSLPEYSGYEWLGNVFAFEPVGADITLQDSPLFIAREAYDALDVLNQLIYRVENLPSDSLVVDGVTDLRSVRGEALVLRAYTHFILSNIFAPAYNDYGKDLPGIECMTEPGNKVRLTVAETYDLVQEDLEDGINEMQRYGFPQSVWRFNERAAYAFAARFFLFRQEYEMCVDYATLALGSNPSAVTMDWRKFEGVTTVGEIERLWHEEDEPSVFMMLDTHSMMMRYMIEGCRYAFNGAAIDGTFSFSPICNLSLPPYLICAGLLTNGEQRYGIMSCKVAEHFEMTDSVLGIGYPMITRNEFTAEETLLCRAEANLMLGRTDEALADMDIWGLSKQDCSGNFAGSGVEEASNYYYDLSIDAIKAFYAMSGANYTPKWASVNYDNSVYSDMLSNYGTTGMPALDEDGMAVLRYVLHSRRLETLHDGMRFFDLKRFNIDYKHWIGNNDGLTPAREEVLTYDDPRRALTMPDLPVEEETTDSVGAKSLRAPYGLRQVQPQSMPVIDRVDAVSAMAD